MKQVGLLESKTKGLIIVADDQYVNLQALRMTIEDIGKSASESLRMFSNGQEVIECVDELLSYMHDISLDKGQAPL